MSDFETAVTVIARKRAIQFFVTRAIIVTVIVAATVMLAGCTPPQTCVDGKLYHHGGGDTYIRDEWQRECLTMQPGGKKA